MPQYSRLETRRKTRRRARRLLALNLFLAAVLALTVWRLTTERPAGGSPAAPRDAAPAATAPSVSAGEDPGDGTERPGETGSEPDPGIDDTPSPGPDAFPSPDGSGGFVTIAFVGDILPAGRVAEAMNREGADYPFRNVRDLLTGADIAAGNLETPVTTRGMPAENKQYVFRASPDHVPALREAGFDVLSLANNHTLDQGWEGLQDTIAHLEEAGLAHMGAGANEQEAYAPALIERNGMTVAFLGFSRVVPEVSWKAGPRNPGVAEAYDTRRAVAAIREAKEKADLVVVMVHWGLERKDFPEPYQRKMGREFIDAGADLVIGSHAHVLQGLEPYKGKWIAYSLGNFVFTTAGVSKTQETGVLVAECDKEGNCRLTFHPMFAENFQPGPMEPEAARRLLKRLEALSFGVAIDADGVLTASGEAGDDGASPSPAASIVDADATRRTESVAGAAAPRAEEGR